MNKPIQIWMHLRWGHAKPALKSFHPSISTVPFRGLSNLLNFDYSFEGTGPVDPKWFLVTMSVLLVSTKLGTSVSMFLQGKTKEEAEKIKKMKQGMRIMAHVAGVDISFMACYLFINEGTHVS